MAKTHSGFVPNQSNPALVNHIGRNATDRKLCLCKEETVERHLVKHTCPPQLRDRGLKQIERPTRLLLDMYGQCTAHEERHCVHHEFKIIIPMQSLCSIVHTYPEMSREARPGRHYRSSTVGPTREHQMQGEPPAGPWHFVESAKFSPPGNAGNQKLSVGIKLLPRSSCTPPCAFQPIVRPALAERSEWRVKQTLRSYCRLALQRLCFESHQSCALRKLEGT